MSYSQKFSLISYLSRLSPLSTNASQLNMLGRHLPAHNAFKASLHYSTQHTFVNTYFKLGTALNFGDKKMDEMLALKMHSLMGHRKTNK